MEETKRRLRRGMRVESGPVLFDLPMMLKTELRGNIEGDTFWLQSTRPHMMNLPQRYFRGTLTQEGERTVIEGKFRHTGFQRVAVPAAILLLCLLPLGSMGWVLPLFALAMALVGWALGRAVYAQDETTVAEYLNRL